jgi:hypothetical protein
MQKLSPSRERLAARISERVNTLASIAAEQANANRLSVIHDAVSPARRALEEFDSEQASAYARWAKGGVNGRPKVASAIRAELVSALSDAEQSSAAAKAAQAGFQSASERAAVPLAGLAQAVREAAKLVVIEEATALLPAIKEAIANAESLRHKLDDARAEAMDGFGGFGTNDFPETTAALAVFDTARGGAEARPVKAAGATSWRKFSAALQQDAKVCFEDAQAMAVPLIAFIPTATDAATAAMMAAASFPTQSIVR